MLMVDYLVRICDFWVMNGVEDEVRFFFLEVEGLVYLIYFREYRWSKV